MNHPTPSRTLPPRPDLDQLRRQAKELLAGYRRGDPNASGEIESYYRNPQRDTFALHDAQLVLARAYGFESWPKLKAFVDGVTIRRFADAVTAGDEESVLDMLRARPELINRDIAPNDERRAIHFAVLEHKPEMVRLLMRRGADARKGIYPHRDATGARTLAAERGYGDLVAIIEEEERRRQRHGQGEQNQTSNADEFSEALARGDEDAALAVLEANPAIASSTNRNGWTPLHVAAAARAERAIWDLLARGANPNATGPGNRKPLDNAVGRGWHGPTNAESLARIAGTLRQHGATLTARAAAALGDAEWLLARHRNGLLENPIEDWGGLLSIAVLYDRPEVLTVLLDLGFDPDEAMRVEDLEESIVSAGMPLWHCAVRGQRAMAEDLLKHGADPNANVYASGTPTFQAHGKGDTAMVELLERHGGRFGPDALGHHRETGRAARMFAEADEGHFPEGFPDMEALASEMLWSAACGGDPEIVAMCLARLDWPEGDERWFWPMQQPLRLWNHMGGFWQKPQFDRATYLPCLQSILDRSGPNVVGRFGLTLLHDVAALRDYVTPEERTAFAQELISRGARLDARDEILRSTPLGWACRWGRKELVELLLAHGADPEEADAEPWAKPAAWAKKRGHDEIRASVEPRFGST